jgi:glycosyltransferase involved in cell wall biosynthesis
MPRAPAARLPVLAAAGGRAMIAAAFAVPGDLNLPTGGYIYARRVLERFPLAEVELRHVALPASFPAAGGEDIAATLSRLHALSAKTIILFDGLAYGAMPAAAIAALKQPIVALVHHPLGLEAGLSLERRRQLVDLETAALALARRVIVTSRVTQRTLIADFAVPSGKIAIAEPGTQRAARARGTGAPPQLLSVGSIVPRKAYDILVRALKPLAALPWQLTIVGATDRCPTALAQLKAGIAESGLGPRVTIAGPLRQDELALHYDRADLFVLPSLYEGYGMALAEAMARGLPIVCTTGGAAAETVPDRAAIKVAPGDVAALTAALARVLADPDFRLTLAEAAWAAGQVLPAWEETARIIAGVIKESAA